MKIYTDRNEYENDLTYYCNACGEVFIDGIDSKPEDLPLPLQKAYDELWSDGTGSYCYLVKYKDEYGLALINEYHEFTDEGKSGEMNNYEQAVKVGNRVENMFPYTVFIGKEMGFPGTTPDGSQGDYATELVVFIKPETSRKDFNAIADWLYNNAYKNIEHPDACYSRDMNNNCTIIKWGESGYYKTDYPEGKYTDDIVDEINLVGNITPEMRRAMECCSIASQSNPNLNWEKHYKMCLQMG
ncbi:MAG: hypothetical protein J5929_01925 [Eubacterium sp.]|nr:hypothetical protein [Eubacterium sp.]